MDRSEGLCLSDLLRYRVRAAVFPRRKPVGGWPARDRRGGLAALLPCVALVALAGCGSSDNGVASKSGKEILVASKAAAISADSVHVAGRNSQGPLSLTINLSLAGSGSRGQVSLFGLDFEVIRIGSTVYVKGTEAFYARLGSVLSTTPHVPKGTWLKAPAGSGPLAQLAALADLSGELGRLLSSTGPITKGATMTVNGQKAIELKQTAKLFSGSLFIATTGKPYPVEIVKRGREHGTITFSRWNQPVSLSAPANAVEISQLKGAGR